NEITAPIVGSTITPVVVFLPLALLTGVTGVFFRSLALTMSVALLTSLVLALTFTPVLAERFVNAARTLYAPTGSPATRDGAGRGAQRAPMTHLQGAYDWLLARALARRKLVLVLIGVVAVLTF